MADDQTTTEKSPAETADEVETFWDTETADPRYLGTTGGGRSTRGPNPQPGGDIDLEGREPPYEGRTTGAKS